MRLDSANKAQLDPVKYEIFAHRLWAIGEAGRQTLQRVSASPIVVQGGECMQSFYDVDGNMVLACAGHLRFAGATSDALRYIIKEFGSSPGFFDGDQIFFNDPYLAGAHTYDQMVIKPLFFDDELIGWTSSSSHTADTGGIMRGGATEIYHEGIRILGLKIVEKGEYRNDVSKTIVEQCRDPYYVELDMRSRIAANNVADDRIQELLERLGVDFAKAAFQRLIDDGEIMARARIRELPNGVWRSRLVSGGEGDAVHVSLTMTKKDDEMWLDFSDISEEQRSAQNSTLPSSLAHVALALTPFLFWDVPWSDGKMVPIHVTIPEGSIANCRFPAACGAAPGVGQMLVTNIHECIGKMLFAAGRMQDVSAGWRGHLGLGGPGIMYGGHNREGIVVPQGMYDGHGAGFGATPLRDGINTGGYINIPAGGISDVERIELQYPFLYFTRQHTMNGGGPGKYRGGTSSCKMVMIYGSQDFTVPYARREGYAIGGYGLFGGYPIGPGGTTGVFRVDYATLRERLSSGDYPITLDELEGGGWAEAWEPGNGRVHLPEGSILTDVAPGAAGFGDPLERDPVAVARDVSEYLYSVPDAERWFGVVVKAGSVDAEATETKRIAIRDERKRLGVPGPLVGTNGHNTHAAYLGLSPHAGLKLAGATPSSEDRWWVCASCGQSIAPVVNNYKDGTLLRVRTLDDYLDRPPPGTPVVALQEYACPGCGELLQVDLCPVELADTERLWDIELTGLSRFG